MNIPIKYFKLLPLAGTMSFFRSILFIIISLSTTLTAAQNPIKITRTPNWVAEINYPIQIADTVHAGGWYDLLFERQFNTALRQSYFRTAVKVLTEKGLETASSINVNYDPSYQHLIFHSVLVKRGDMTIDKLVKSKFEIIRRERNIERLVYDKSLDAILNLDDIQVGDIIEYSYSVSGYNPIFNNKFSKTIYFNFSTPAGRMYTRIVSAADRTYEIKKFNGAENPIKSQTKNVVTYTWDALHVPALLMEDKTPSWYNPYSYIQISEYNTWHDILTWALPLYSTKNISALAIDKKIDEIRNKYKSLDEQINACIQFVQDEIRYLAFSGGVQGYKPHSPAVVFKQRFGDCKDKSLLLSYMLNKLHVESHPALVNTESGMLLKDELPSPFAFDHCIVNLTLNDSVYWVDPTATLQRGPLRKKQIPNYYAALVISDHEHSLRSFASSSTESSQINVHEIFTLENVGGAARLDVQSEYSGAEADFMRGYSKSNSTEEIKNSYTNFYANDYTAVKAEKNVEFNDDINNNIVKTTELYSIDNFWTYDSAAGGYTATLYPRVLADYLTSPSSKMRVMPYVINHAVTINQVITIHLPEGWDIKDSSKKIKSKGFEYSAKKIHSSKQNVTLYYSYKSLKSYLNADEVKDHLRQVDAALNDLSFVVTVGGSDDVSQSTETSTALNVPFILISIAMAAFTFVVCRKLYCYDPRSATYKFAYQHVGGWMMLPFIGIALSPLILAYRLFSQGYFNYVQWRILTDPTYVAYNPALGALVLLELFYNLFVIGYCALLLKLILQRRTSLPVLICAFYALNLIFETIDRTWLYFLNSVPISTVPVTMISSILGVVLWIPFFLKADRVKGTFTNRLN